VGDKDLRRLGFDASPGAAVLDGRGALVGVVSTAANGEARWVPLSAIALANATAAAAPIVPAHAGPALVAPDEIYEAGLHRALQVLVEDDPG
jgi:hypothetical protein